MYKAKIEEATRRKDERITEKGVTSNGNAWQSITSPALQLKTEANWLAISTIEAFFSWTEHALIHLALLTGRILTAKEVAALAEADWPMKFKTAIDLATPEAKNLFDRLLVIRKDLRNYVAHGAFGKQGEAFKFHSGAGAAPVLLPHRAGNRKFRIGHGLSFDSIEALQVIEEFTSFLWAGTRAPAQIYIQQSNLPIWIGSKRRGRRAHAARQLVRCDKGRGASIPLRDFLRAKVEAYCAG